METRVFLGHVFSKHHAGGSAGPTATLHGAHGGTSTTAWAGRATGRTRPCLLCGRIAV
ncbi:hypothetical protein [Oryza sativa Japonica Group]|uniref:Uncharacterized protein n=1 Tax=Oryza sativa subsp. japonica TaxID=39947 RepID=Q5ZB82_ORYSJ|nr:hypothetical protein [Oryza sativa Japonica Group]